MQRGYNKEWMGYAVLTNPACAGMTCLGGGNDIIFYPVMRGELKRASHICEALLFYLASLIHFIKSLSFGFLPYIRMPTL